MKIEVVSVGKGFVAPTALIRFLIRVDTLMFFQNIFSRKAFITLAAHIMFLIRVGKLVIYQTA